MPLRWNLIVFFTCLHYHCMKKHASVLVIVFQAVLFQNTLNETSLYFHSDICSFQYLF
jgi:hypothetical protein